MKSFGSIPLMIAALCLSACSATNPPREYIDNDTAATVTIAGGAFVFARERSDLAVHAQDYITIMPLQINRAGQRTIYLYCQIWSTIDRRDGAAIVSAKSTLAVVADDRKIPLPEMTTEIRKFGLGHLPVPDQHANEIRMVAIESELFRFMLDANELRVALGEGSLMQYFTLWRDGRASAREFLGAIAPLSRAR